MTLRQRNILERFLKDTDKRIDQVFYLRGGTSTKNAVTIEYTQFRRDGSGTCVKLSFAEDGYPIYCNQAEVKT